MVWAFEGVFVRSSNASPRRGKVRSPGSIRALASMTALLLSLTLPAAGTDADPNAGPDYGARPAPLGEAVRASGFFAHSLEAGTGVVDAVEVFNLTNGAASFDIYAADMVQSTAGGLTAASPDLEVTGPGTWVSPKQGTVQVEPRSSARVEFTVDVPQGTAPGNYFASLLVEPLLPVGTGNIETRARIGLRVEIEVLGEVDLGVGLAPLTFVRESGEVRFELSATNTGSVTFASDGSVVVVSGSGDPVAELSLEPSGRFVAPGEQIIFQAVWENPPLFGRYMAEADLQAVVGNRLPVRFPSNTVAIWLVPWTLIGTGLLVLGGVGWVLYASRQRRGKWIRHRREERALLRDFRERRRVEESGSEQSRRRTPVG